MNKNVKLFLESSKECAQYIMDSDCEQASYSEYIQEGNDPRDHILYHAAVVLGCEKDFEVDIREWKSNE